MLNPTPPVSTRYGAPMGRHPGPEYLCASSGRIQLRHIPLDRGGYDPGGAYWGLGRNLYWACDGDGNQMFFRASNRAQAKAYLTELFGSLHFYR